MADLLAHLETRIAAIARTELGSLEGSFAAQRAELVAALDFAFTGA